MTNDEGGAFGFEFAERPVVELAVEDGVGQLVSEGLHPLGG